jgi:hypothetical protein
MCTFLSVICFEPGPVHRWSLEESGSIRDILVHHKPIKETLLTHNIDSTALVEAMEQVIEHGMDGLGSAMFILLNEAMKIKRTRALQAGPWEQRGLSLR